MCFWQADERQRYRNLTISLRVDGPQNKLPYFTLAERDTKCLFIQQSIFTDKTNIMAFKGKHLVRSKIEIDGSILEQLNSTKS